MKKIVNKYSCVFFFFIGSFVMLVNAQTETPEPHYCCEELAPPDGQEGNPAYAEYWDCVNSPNPEAYCAVPVDNSKYVYISIVAGVALASFVIARKMNTKKTPM